MSKSLVASNMGALRQYMKSATGLDGNWGVVGVCGTRRQQSYHLGRSEIYSPCGKGNADYTVQHQRDKRGLSEYSAGFDFGSKLGRARLVKLTTYLEKQAKAGKLDLQEFLGPRSDGRAYWWGRSNGWTPVRQAVGNSHEWHVHVSFPRDLTHPDMGLPDLIGMFEPHFGARSTQLPPDDPEPPDDFDTNPPENDMPPLSTYLPGHEAKIADPTGPATVRLAPSPVAPVVRSIPKGSSETWLVTGWVKGDYSAFGNSDQWMTRWANNRWEYTAKGNVASVTAPTDPLELSACEADRETLRSTLTRTEAELNQARTRIAAARSALG